MPSGRCPPRSISRNARPFSVQRSSRGETVAQFGSPHGVLGQSRPAGIPFYPPGEGDVPVRADAASSDLVVRTQARLPVRLGTAWAGDPVEIVERVQPDDAACALEPVDDAERAAREGSPVCFLQEHHAGLDEQRAAAPWPRPDRHRRVDLDPCSGAVLIHSAAGGDLVPEPLSAAVFGGESGTARGDDGHKRRQRLPGPLSRPPHMCLPVSRQDPLPASRSAHLRRNGIRTRPSAAGNNNDPELASSPKSVAGRTIPRFEITDDPA